MQAVRTLQWANTVNKSVEKGSGKEQIWLGNQHFFLLYFFPGKKREQRLIFSAVSVLATAAVLECTNIGSLKF